MQSNPEWQRLVPDDYRSQKSTASSLEPRDWSEILRRARKNETYQEQRITRDTPVFNVDFPSAAAYAKWKGRRLPTMEEWLRALGGDKAENQTKGRPQEPNQANLGIKRDEASSRDPGDTFLNAAPGESFPNDRGPFGHMDMGGNISEWAVGPLQRPVVLGGNFTDPEPISLERSRRQDTNRRDPPAKTQLEMIGFRTAR